MELNRTHLGNKKGKYDSRNDEKGNPERHLPSWNDFQLALLLGAQKPSVTGSIGGKFHREM
jgi:hypothetical protein